MDEQTIAAAAAETAASGDNTVVTATDPVATADNEAAGEAQALQTRTADAADAPCSPEGAYLPVYNGEVCPLRMSEREEITKLLQLGMKQREFLPSYERLRRLAANSGAKSVDAYIEALSEQQEAQWRAEAVERYGEEAGARIYELERAAREPQSPPPAAVHRLGNVERVSDEFMQLQQQQPQYHTLTDVPTTVLSIAAENGISLLDAHNRFTLAEQQRKAGEQRAHSAAARYSTGSLADGGRAASPSVIEAFRAGLYRRM